MYRLNPTCIHRRPTNKACPSIKWSSIQRPPHDDVGCRHVKIKDELHTQTPAKKQQQTTNTRYVPKLLLFSNCVHRRPTEAQTLMRLYMNPCIYLYISISVYTHTCTYLSIYLCNNISISTYPCVRIPTRPYLYQHIRMYP